MKIVLTSDLHGSLPEVPECDLLLVGGDICPMDNHDPTYQADWLDSDFRDWLEKVPAKTIVGIAGNHDFVFDTRPEEVPKDLHWTYLQDEEVTVTKNGESVRIYGTPWVPNLHKWAFFGGYARCDEAVSKIPQGLDILLSHGPMYGYADIVLGAGAVGCEAMREHMRTLKPKMFVCGHIHEGYGRFQHRYIERGVYNVARMTAGYEPINPLVEIDW